MATLVHFINVGQGNMTLLQLASGQTFLYDCNVTNENEDEVLGYIAKQVGWGSAINVFVCSHRDADHMRGVKKVNDYFPIKRVWDSGVTGTTPNSTEYREYMDLRRSVGFLEVERRKYYDYGNTRLRVMNSRNDDLPDDANVESQGSAYLEYEGNAQVVQASNRLLGVDMGQCPHYSLADVGDPFWARMN